MTKDTTTDRSSEDDQCADSDGCTAVSRDTESSTRECEPVHDLLGRVEGVLNRRAFLRTTASAGVALHPNTV